MTSLHTALRNQLEKAVVAAREAAEKAARVALEMLAVNEDKPFTSMDEEQRALRRLLREEMRRLGSLDALVSQCAYVHWHRMIFARFLAENDLLMYDTNTRITLADCAELAKDEGDVDAWAAAARYASAMLPGIFGGDDPTLKIRFATEGRLALEKLLTDLPPAVFHADDSLGWIYQFWQTTRKKAVNDSGDKVSGADISAVTQLFTEHYMVQFLLHNTLGAWWVSRHPDEPLPTDLEYLRRKEDGTPAAGDFKDWPQTASELRVLDPSTGSGHFLVAAFALLRRFRMIEENLSEADAGAKVLSENLFGLELDPRCTQIAAFNLTLAAWKSGGYRTLPIPDIACSGVSVGGSLADWKKLAGDDANLQNDLFALFHQFKDAPDVGSLIDPNATENKGFVKEADSAKVLLALEKAMERFGKEDDPASAIFGESAKGAVRAARILAGKYHLVVTNVPYLARGKQGKVLADFCLKHYKDAKADLATAFVERSLSFCENGGTTALVTPQNWLFLPSYRKLRETLLKNNAWDFVARLGAKAFQTPMWDFNVMLCILTKSTFEKEHQMAGLDVSTPKGPEEKAELLCETKVLLVPQSSQLKNPDQRVTLEIVDGGMLLDNYAICVQGLATSDDPQFVKNFWELVSLGSGWEPLLSTVQKMINYGGRERILHWEDGKGRYLKHALSLKAVGRLGGWKSGTEARGKLGICVQQMGDLPCTLYLGEFFDHNASVIVPKDEKNLLAIWAYCNTKEFNETVRKIDQSLKVSNATLVKVPFDLAHWQKVADEKYPNGLPEPYSNDPTQWLFDGNPAESTEPLHTAMARLLGYRWPQNGEDDLHELADDDGIVCLPPVVGEQPAAERLRAFLAKCGLGTPNFSGGDLEQWLRDAFFKEHCKLFHNRPFLWHIWDGRKDGFAAIVNYHQLDHTKLGKLIYTYLGSWITEQERADREGVAGANARLVAAQGLQEKLQQILEGTAPYDIYVRWKTKEQQPKGWNPDLNDGVRLNIRPFVKAEILRSKFTINWNKDRGKNPDGSERINDLHN